MYRWVKAQNHPKIVVDRDFSQAFKGLLSILPVSTYFQNNV